MWVRTKFINKFPWHLYLVENVKMLVMDLKVGAAAPDFELPDQDGKIKKIYEKVKPAIHAEEVLKDLANP